MADVEVTDRKETRPLSCKLTKAEFILKSTEYAQLDEKLAGIEAERKVVADDYKDKIGGVNAQRGVLRRQILTRTEVRDVSCTWHADWASKSMLLRRDDNGEVVEARTMTATELQRGFDFTGEGKQLPPPDDNPLDDLNS